MLRLPRNCKKMHQHKCCNCHEKTTRKHSSRLKKTSIVYCATSTQNISRYLHSCPSTQQKHGSLGGNRSPAGYPRERLQPPNLHSKTLANRMPYRTHSGMVIRCFKGLEPSCSNYIVKKESSRHRFEIVLLNKGVFFLRSFGLRFTRCSFLFSSNTVPPHLKPFTRLACQVFHQ